MKILKRKIYFIYAILALAFLSRFLFLSDTIQFGGDQTDHLNFTKSISDNFGYIWHGAKALEKNCQGQIWEAYLGPFYYYLMYLPLLLSRLNPIGPSILGAILGAISAYFIYLLGSRAFDRRTGFFAAIFFGFSTALILSSRIIWNPYYLPFFLIIFYLSFVRLAQGKEKYLMIMAAMIALMSQLHASTILLLPGLIAGFFILKIKIQKKIYWLYGSGIVILAYLPMIFHEITNRFANSKSFYKIIFNSKNCGAFDSSYFENLISTAKKFIYSIADSLGGRVYESTWSIWPSGNIEKNFQYFILVSFALACLYIIYKWVVDRKDKLLSYAFTAIVFIIFFLLGASFFGYNIYSYYFIPILPMVFIIYAFCLSQISKTKIGLIITAILLTGFVIWNLYSYYGYTRARIERDSRSNLIFADLVLSDQLLLVDFIEKDSQGQQIAIEYTSMYEGGAFRYINVYQYLIERKKILIDDNAEIRYLIIVPRLTNINDKVADKKLLVDRNFGGLRLVKYENQ